MKKILTMIIAMSLTLTLTGCGTKEETKTPEISTDETGEKVNNSEDLNQDKTFGNYKITEITLKTEDGVNTLRATIENISSSNKENSTVVVSTEQVTSSSKSDNGITLETVAKTETKTESSKNTEPEEKQPTQITTPVAKMDQHLFFIIISGDGSVIRKEVVRQIPKTNTPLTAAINALLAGPNMSELENDYMSLIPEGTKLLGASVNNGVATINFSENFLFNKYGVEGIYGQLMQVVYTATAFSNIDSVQFLIEGAKQDYLGEGVYVGAPLPRSVFR